MDPASAIGLIVTIQQILVSTYQFGQSVRGAKEDIRKLAVELSALKASLDHFKLVYDDAKNPDRHEGSPSILETSNLYSPESKKMLEQTEQMLKDLIGQLKPATTTAKKVVQSLTWHFKKSEVDEYLKRIDSAKLWFVSAATTDNLMVALSIWDLVRDIDRKQDLRHAEQETIQLQKDVRDWLGPRDSEDYFHQCLDRYLPGLCNWFFDAEFKDWLQGDSPLPGIWLKANSGFGKTTLIASAIDRARKLGQISSKKVAVIFWFCSFDDQAMHTSQTILTNMIYQLCCSEPSLFAELDKLHPRSKDGLQGSSKNRLTSKQLEELFISLAAGVEDIQLFVDAINESTSAAELLTTFNTISSMCPNMRFMITSTEATEANADVGKIRVINASRGQNGEDVNLYISYWLAKQEQELDIPESTKEKIRSTIRKNAKGGFRWVQCQLQDLSELDTIRDMEDALQRLPPSIEEYYHKVLKAVPTKNCLRVQGLLMWLSHARVTMYFDELQEAVVLIDAYEKGQLRGGKPLDDGQRLKRPSVLLDYCPRLINYDKQSSKIRLAHASVYDFTSRSENMQSLAKTFDFGKDSADYILARLCLTYMMFPEFATGYVDSRWRVNKRKRAWRLLHYIAHTLWDHLYEVDPNGPIKPLLFAFLDSYKLPRGGNFAAWVQAFNPWMSPDRIMQSTPLFWAAREGHIFLLRILLASSGKDDLEVGGGQLRSTPLHSASWQGHTEIVRELLDAGADVRELNTQGESALFWARACKHKDIVKMLEEAYTKAGLSLDHGMNGLRFKTTADSK